VTDEPPRPRVVLSNRQSGPVDEEDLIDLARRTLLAEGVTNGELSVSLVTEGEMAELHQRYLGEPGPTDVLSFPQDPSDSADRETLLGDVVICPGFARSQGDDPLAELRLLLVHGILHLLGYDHEADEERAAMWERQATYSGVRIP
jgi:probable rRNA maturation factor